MRNLNTIFFILFMIAIYSACSKQLISFSSDNLDLVNREVLSSDNGDSETLVLNNKNGDGFAIVNTVNFYNGTIELELKGENKPGRSFVGVAFNIQNDSTYEAVYFRPFNFQAVEETKRNRSVQYISHPENTWRYLRSNFPGKYESDYTRMPSPDSWFGVSVKVSNDKVLVYDLDTKTELLNVERIDTHKSSKIGLWTGNNSKGAFRNLRILD